MCSALACCEHRALKWALLFCLPSVSNTTAALINLSLFSIAHQTSSFLGLNASLRGQDPVRDLQRSGRLIPCLSKSPWASFLSRSVDRDQHAQRASQPLALTPYFRMGYTTFSGGAECSFLTAEGSPVDLLISRILKLS